jgi:hypothetical protein
MTDVVSGAFLPPHAVAARAAATLPPRAAVLGRPEHALPVAAALAGDLRAREGAGAALVGVWPAEALRAGLATRAATRLAERLSVRGLPAVSRGRLAWLPLDESPAAFERVAAAIDEPAVLAITGPRSTATDGLLAEQHLIVVVAPVDADSALSELTVAGLAALPAAVMARPPIEPSAVRMLALAGWGRLPDRTPPARDVAR